MAQIHLTTKNETLIIQGTLQEFLINVIYLQEFYVKPKIQLCLMAVILKRQEGRSLIMDVKYVNTTGR